MSNLSDYDFKLPKELIAQYPLRNRANSRLLVLKKDQKPQHVNFTDILEHLSKDDALVLNDTKVFPARIFGHRAQSGSKIEILLYRQTGPKIWICLIRSNSSLKPGTQLEFGSSIKQRF